MLTFLVAAILRLFGQEEEEEEEVGEDAEAVYIRSDINICIPTPLSVNIVTWNSKISRKRTGVFHGDGIQGVEGER